MTETKVVITVRKKNLGRETRWFVDCSEHGEIGVSLRTAAKALGEQSLHSVSAHEGNAVLRNEIR